MQQRNYKIVIVGDGDTGKTTFVTRHVEGAFVRDYQPTIGINLKNLSFQTTQGQFNFTIYDTAGQEKFGGIRDSHYINADACFLFFDVTSRQTYQNVAQWYQDVSRVAENCKFVLVGNKCDIQNREVRAQNVNFHRKHQMRYCEISAKTNANYAQPWEFICQELAGDKSLRLTQEVALQPTEVLLSQEQIAQMQQQAQLANQQALPDEE